MTTAKTKKAPAEKKPLEGKEVDSLEEIEARKEETGQALANQLVIDVDPTYKNMYVVKREEGGKVPLDLSGRYTSQDLAEKAISAFLSTIHA